MIKMNRMTHILRNLLLAALTAGLAASCAKTAEDATQETSRLYFDAWMAIHYPDAVEKDGVYIIDDQPGTGLEWRENLPVTLLNYTVRSLDGAVTHNADEDMARQLGIWTNTGYYGPQVTMTGENVSFAGLDAVLEGMRQGGTRTAIIPSWMMTYKRYTDPKAYPENPTGNEAAIYTVTFREQTADLSQYEFRRLQQYASGQWAVTDTLGTAAVFFKSFTRFDSEPAALPKDTTVYINYTGRRVYDGQVFDTSVADTAKLYNIYNPSKTYAPVAINWSETPDGMTMGSGTDLIDGFKHGLYAMHADEKASFAFGYQLGYKSSAKGELIPAYAALQYDIELVPKP